MSYDRILEVFDIDWVRFAVFAGAGLIIGLFLSSLVGALGKRTKRKLVSDGAGRLTGIIFVICFILGVRFGLEAFDLEPNVQLQLSRIFVIVVYVLVTWALTRVYDVVHEQVIKPWGQRKDNVSIVDVLRTFVMVLMWTLGLLSALNSAGYNVSAVLAGLGIGGLALALAAQDAVANIFGGIIILTQSPFKVGDQITVGGTNGWVLNIGLRSTLIANWYGNHITIPNKAFTDSQVTNVDARTIYWEEVKPRLRHDSTMEQIEQAIEIIGKVLDSADDLGETTWVGIAGIGEGYVELEVWFGVQKFAGAEDSYPNEYMKILGVRTKVLLAMLRALEDASIHLAVPLERHIVSQTPEPPAETRFC